MKNNNKKICVGDIVEYKNNNYKMFGIIKKENKGFFCMDVITNVEGKYINIKDYAIDEREIKKIKFN